MIEDDDDDDDISDDEDDDHEDVCNLLFYFLLRFSYLVMSRKYKQAYHYDIIFVLLKSCLYLTCFYLLIC